MAAPTNPTTAPSDPAIAPQSHGSPPKPHGNPSNPITAPQTLMSPSSARDEHSGDPYHSGYDMPYSGGGAGPTYGPPQPWGHPEMHVMQHHILPIQAR